MKINNLLENITAASSPENATNTAPKMGRSDKFLEDQVEESTTSGCVASVAAPVGKMQRRGKGSIFSGIKTSDKFPNSKVVKEGAYEDGVRDGIRGEANPRASSIYGPESSEYSRGYDDGLVKGKEQSQANVSAYQASLAPYKEIPTDELKQMLRDIRKRTDARQSIYDKYRGASRFSDSLPPNSEELKQEHKKDHEAWQAIHQELFQRGVSNDQRLEEEQLDEIFNPTSHLAGFLRTVSSGISDYLPALAAGLGTFVGTSALVGPVAAAMAAGTVGQQFITALNNNQNKIPGWIQQVVEKYFGSEQEKTEFSLIHAKAAFQGQSEFRWRGQQWPVTLKQNEAEAIIEKGDRYWLEQYQRQQGMSEAKKANTKAARKEFGKRDKKPTLSDKEQETKQSESDRLWAMLQQHIADAEKNKDVKEGEEMGTFAALKDWQVWDVLVFNNYYRGKYADYGPRPYSVVASSPEEARQVVLNNADYVLQDLLSRKLVNGKKVLPRGSALPVEEKRVGKADPGTITTMGLKKMLTPDGVQSFKFTNGKIVDGAHVQGGEETMDESLEKDFQKVDYRKFSTPTLMNALKTLAKSKTPNVDLQKGITRELLNRVKNKEGVAEESVAESKTFGPDTPYEVKPGEDFSLVFKPGKRSGVHYHMNSGMVADPFYFVSNGKLYSVTNQGDGIPKEVQQGVAEEKQRLDPKCWTGYKKQGTKMKGDTRVNNCVKVDEAEFTEDKLASDLYRDLQIFKKGAPKDIGSKAKDKEIGNKPQDKDIVAKEDWQKTNKQDKTDGMSPKAVKAYRRENPGSKLKTAVTKKPSELKPGSKDANRRKSFCARMSGNKGPMKDENGKPTPKAKALKRWNC